MGFPNHNFFHTSSTATPRVGRARAAQPSGEEPRGTGGQGLHPLHRTQGDAAAWRGRNSFVQKWPEKDDGKIHGKIHGKIQGNHGNPNMDGISKHEICRIHGNWNPWCHKVTIWKMVLHGKAMMVSQWMPRGTRHIQNSVPWYPLVMSK